MKKKLTHKEFVEKLLLKNKQYASGDFSLTSEYIGSNDPIGCHCNIHNTDWSPLPVELCRNRNMCPDCGREIGIRSRTISREEFVERLNKQIPNVKLVGQYVNMTTRTWFECEKQHQWYVTPNNVLNTLYGCPYCSGRKTLAGFNDMWTTRPDLASMLTYPEDGYKYTFASNKKAWFNCPDCGTPSLKTINNVAMHNFGCQHCSDSVSYPNKFSRALLDQLPIESYDCEYQPEWVEPYYYDNHFWYNGVEYILEMDGALHSKEQTFSRTTMQQIQEADLIKDRLAEQHDIHMIRIDCIKSDMEYIKLNILSSELNDVFDLLNIDWELCDKQGQKNILKEACKLYMSHKYTFADIGKILCVHPATVSNYLKRGSKFGWCDYTPQKEKSVILVNNEGNMLHIFASISECCRKMRRLYETPFCIKCIRDSCRTHKPYKGFNFRFANETQQNN